jgi:D-glycero-D-manno-heptose 1,7-bisphosphate phosphatase
VIDRLRVAPRALFLDRDGTLMVDTGYVRDPAEVRLIDGATAALRRARALGYELIVVSNQSGVGRGLIQQREYEAVHARLLELLSAEEISLDAVYVCFHRPDDGCACRKPAPGLILEAARARDIDLSTSIMIGDKDSDVAAGRAAGTRTLRLGSWAEVEAQL